MKKLIITVALLALTLLPCAYGRETIRLKGGSLLRAGDSKSKLLKAWGFPDMQQGGVFYYNRKGKIYTFTFSGDKIKYITKE